MRKDAYTFSREDFTLEGYSYGVTFVLKSYNEYEFLPAKDQKWIAQAPPGRERLMEYSSKLKKYVRVERIKK